MAIDFPASPNINDTHTDAGRTWTWNGTSWVISTNASNYNLPIATAGSLGGIKVGPNLNINATSGVLDVDLSAYSLVGHTHSYSLNSLTDVDTTGAANDKILKYNGTSWVIGDGTGADGAPGANGVSIGYDSVNSTNTLSLTNATWTDTGLEITYTPKSADSKIILTSFLNLLGRGTGGSAPVNQQNYTTPGTYSWTCPADVTSVSVVCVGGGGGGTTANGYEAGGGGGLGWKNNIAVVPGQSYTVVVGAGGAGNTSGGTNGGQSYFIDAATVSGGGGWG